VLHPARRPHQKIVRKPSCKLEFTAYGTAHIRETEVGFETEFRTHIAKLRVGKACYDKCEEKDALFHLYHLYKDTAFAATALLCIFAKN
jgi:hypothetical protein